MGWLLVLPLQGHAQGADSVGKCQGDVPGIGAARLVVTGVGANGLVAGRMEFDLQAFVSTLRAEAELPEWRLYTRDDL